jgi:hypothetical protein
MLEFETSMLLTLTQKSSHRGVVPRTLPICGHAMRRYILRCLITMSPLLKSIPKCTKLTEFSSSLTGSESQAMHKDLLKRMVV